MSEHDMDLPIEVVRQKIETVVGDIRTQLDVIEQELEKLSPEEMQHSG